VKLLLDQNLSHHLVAALQSEFPGSAHVRDLGLERADDATLWDFARGSGHTIVSKDVDFHQRSFLHGHPPKVVWLRLGNSSTGQILETLRAHFAHLREFDRDPDASFLILS